MEYSYSLKKGKKKKRTQNLSIIDQEKQKIQQIYIWNPFTHYQFNYVNIDLRHQYGISVAWAQTSLLAKPP